MTTPISQNLAGKVVLITGGGTGIGRASAEQFLARGAKVFVTGRREDPLKALKADHPDSVAFLTADVTKRGEAKRVVEAVLREWDHLDVLVNNAGTGAMGPLSEITDDDLETTFAVNVLGLLRITRDALPALIKTKGQVINISSTVAQAATPGVVAYAASKAAVEHATRNLAAEVGPAGVRVNAVAPGATKTDQMSAMPEEMQKQMAMQTPLGRLGDPADIGRVVAMLASDDAAWMTGQVVQASGGFML